MTKKLKEREGVPGYKDLINPTFKALKELGGTAYVPEIRDRVISNMNVTEDILKIMQPNKNETLFYYKIKWVLTWMSKADVISIPKRNYRKISPKFANTDELSEEIVEFIIGFNRGKSKEVKNTNPEFEPKSHNISIQDIFTDSPEEYEDEDEIKKYIRKMSPFMFEHFCKVLLERCGIKNVLVTQRSRDHGIDGIGRLEINDIFSIKIVFQCKKYNADNPISASDIQRFRGATIGHGDAEMGLFITTSRFTEDAKREATLSNIKEIHLMDMDDIIDKVKKYEIGVVKKHVYLVDEEFYNSFK